MGGHFNIGTTLFDHNPAPWREGKLIALHRRRSEQNRWLTCQVQRNGFMPLRGVERNQQGFPLVITRVDDDMVLAMDLTVGSAPQGGLLLTQRDAGFGVIEQVIVPL